MAKVTAEQIVAELVKHGWEKAPSDIEHVVIARRPVQTFRGEQFAKVKPVVFFEDGVCSLSAEFISRGENALSLCSAYLTSPDELAAKVAEFHDKVMKGLDEAFSVRMARPSHA